MRDAMRFRYRLSRVSRGPAPAKMAIRYILACYRFRSACAYVRERDSDQATERPGERRCRVWPWCSTLAISLVDPPHQRAGHGSARAEERLRWPSSGPSVLPGATPCARHITRHTRTTSHTASRAEAHVGPHPPPPSDHSRLILSGMRSRAAAAAASRGSYPSSGGGSRCRCLALRAGAGSRSGTCRAGRRPPPARSSKSDLNGRSIAIKRRSRAAPSTSKEQDAPAPNRQKR